MTKSIEWGYMELFWNASKEIALDGVEEAMSNLDDVELEMCWQFWNFGTYLTWSIFDQERESRDLLFVEAPEWKNVEFKNNWLRELPLYDHED